MLGMLCVTITAMAENMARYALNVANFTSLTVVDGVPVDYVCSVDSAGWVVFDAEPEMASCISFTNNKEHLRVQTLSEDRVLVGVPHVRVYSASLHYVENSGDSLVRVHLDKQHLQKFVTKQIGNGSLVVDGVDAARLDASASAGRGFVSLAGAAANLKLSNVGTGTIDASAVKCDKVSCFVLGSGTVDVCTKGTLKITGAGTGYVINSGVAEKTINRTIGIKEKKETNEGAD